MRWLELVSVLGEAVKLGRDAVALRRANLLRELTQERAARLVAEHRAAEEKRKADILTHYATIDRRGS